MMQCTIKSLLVLLALLTTTGCAGKLVCEWQSQSEQFEQVLEKYMEKHNETQKNEP